MGDIMSSTHLLETKTIIVISVLVEIYKALNLLFYFLVIQVMQDALMMKHVDVSPSMAYTTLLSRFRCLAFYSAAYQFAILNVCVCVSFVGNGRKFGLCIA
jgi:hypothetical protein